MCYKIVAGRASVSYRRLRLEDVRGYHISSLISKQIIRPEHI